MTGVKTAVEEMPAVSTRPNVHLSYNARDIFTTVEKNLLEVKSKMKRDVDDTSKRATLF